MRILLNQENIIIKPFLKTTSSEQVEYMKAFELKIIKELGKLIPKLRDKEYRPYFVR
jgi:tRNA(Ile)-lysidine synthase TilS/MesJ